MGRFLERQGLLERDAENTFLSGLALEDEPMEELLAHSITYRIAVGPRAGCEVFTLQTPPAGDEPSGEAAGQAGGFSLHAGVAARAEERAKLERLCRYISRPAVSEQRLSLTPGGHTRYELKTRSQDGTTHVLFEPLDFIPRLAARVPKPRVHLRRSHGGFAPNSRHRAFVTPAKRGRGSPPAHPLHGQTPAEPHAAMTWAQRLKRVFNIDLETCSVCGGAMRIVACIEDPGLNRQDPRSPRCESCRGPGVPAAARAAVRLRRSPQSGLFNPVLPFCWRRLEASAGARLCSEATRSGSRRRRAGL